MFHKNLFLFVFGLLSYCLHAQTLFIGLSAGTAFSTFKTSKDFTSYDYKVGYKIHVPVIYELNRNLSFSTGLSFMNLGASQHVSLGVKYAMDPNDPIYQGFFVNENRFKDHLNYFSIPLTLNINQEFRTFLTYAKIGGYVSYLVSAKEIAIDNTQTYKTKIDLSNGTMNKLDAGILLGIGFVKPVSCGRVYVEAEYMIGKSNVHKSGNLMFPNPTEILNRSIFFNVGYIIKIGNNIWY